MESGGESSTSLASAPIIEPEVALAQKDDVYSYVKAASLALLAETRASELEEALKRDDSLTKFIGDSQAPVLAIEKITTIKDSQEGDEEVVVTFNVRNEVEYKTERSTQVVFIKRTGLIEADKPIPDQVRVTVLNEGNPYETLLAILGKAMTPFFKSFTRETAKGERDGDKLVPAVEKSLNEAEVALLHLQQNIEIPEINLVINPHIQGVIAAAAAKKEKPKVDDLGPGLIEDSDFLNSLQTGVNRWIKEIQKVTKLDRDPSSGTALQEMRFWFNLERALQKIQQKRDSDEMKQRRHELREIAKMGSTRPRTALIQARSGLVGQDLDQLGSDDTLRSVFRRAKPKDLDSSAADIAPYSYQGLLAETEGGARFLYFDSGALDLKRMVIYASDAQFQMLSQSERISFDGTFASAPEPYGSVFSIHCEVGDRFHLAVTAFFMDGPGTRTRQEYGRLLTQITQHPLLATWAPLEAHCDFEQASRLAFLQCFPGLKIRLCLFHKNQSLLKKARALNITRRLVGKTKECYHRLRVMPYLEPASMERALGEIEQHAPVGCQALIDYVRSNYVGTPQAPPRYPPEEWSVFECTVSGKPRTNNSQESFHAKFNETANADNLAGRKVQMSKVLKTLKKEEENVRQIFSAPMIQAQRVRGARKTAAEEREDAINAALVSGLPLLQVLDAIVIATKH